MEQTPVWDDDIPDFSSMKSDLEVLREKIELIKTLGVEERDLLINLMNEDTYLFFSAQDWVRDDAEIVSMVIANTEDEELRGPDFNLELGPNLKQDREFVKSIIGRYPSIFPTLSVDMRRDDEIAEIAATEAPWTLRHVLKKHKTNKQFMLKAVTRYGGSLKYADKTLRDDEDVVLAAIKDSGWAFKYASERLRSEKSFAVAACNTSFHAFKSVAPEIRQDKDIVYAAMSADPVFIASGYVDVQYADTEEAILHAYTSMGEPENSLLSFGFDLHYALCCYQIHTACSSRIKGMFNGVEQENVKERIGILRKYIEKKELAHSLTMQLMDKSKQNDNKRLCKV